jgi:thiol:disulfide interchange protein
MLIRSRILVATALVFLGVAGVIGATAQMSPPFINKHLYSTTANPKVDIASALKQARAEHKRVILDFGGDWCGDCQVLDIYMHQSPNDKLLEKHFVVVHVDIGHMDRNVDVAQRYKVPIDKGVPALAVLDANGTLLYSQKNGDFENMRNMRPEDVTAFLNRWKA